MIDLLLNAAKIVISDDARKSASAIFEFVRRSPEWQKDFCTIEAGVESAASEQAVFLGELAAEKMASLQYTEDSINAFSTAYTELTANAFRHGCGSDRKKKVNLSIDINSHYVALTVRNPKGRKFDVIKRLRDQRETLSRNPNARTGRGLLLVNEFADSLDATGDQEGVKVVFYKPPVSFRVAEIEDVVVIELLSGLKNPSSSRRLAQIVDRYPNRNLIIDFSKYERKGTPKTELLTTYIDLSRLVEQAGKKFVILLSRNPSSDVVSLMMLPMDLLAFSWDQALEKLDRAYLMDKIMRAQQSN